MLQTTNEGSVTHGASVSSRRRQEPMPALNLQTCWRHGQGFILGLLVLAAARAEAGLYTVTTTADSGPGSLREAINLANADTGAGRTIEFGIGLGAKTISPISPLPIITRQVTINGTTQPGYTTSPLIILNGGGTVTEGLHLQARNCQVQALVIQNFAGDGLVLDGGGDHVVQGNFIGSDYLGVSASGNSAAGIRVVGSSGNRIGGTSPGQGNVISANRLGILMESAGSSGNQIQGNFIGTTLDGSAPLGNTREGIVLTSGAANNQIGGSDLGAGNRIAYNGGDGVLVTGGVGTVGNTIVQNSIFANGGIGINLQPAGEADRQVTLNDGLGPDADTGPNNLQNFPSLASVSLAGGTTIVRGSLDSTPSTSGHDRTFRIDLYRSAIANPSGYGDGQTWVDSQVRTTDLGGNATFSFAVGGAFPNQYFTATATDLTTGDTSEFSQTFQANPGVLGFSALTFSVAEDAGPAAAMVKRTGGSYGVVTVDYATSTHFATAGWAVEGLVCGGLVDYVRTNGTLIFADGDALDKRISIPICNDSLVEGDERLTVTLSLATGGALLDDLTKEATLFILDDEIALSISDTGVSDAGCAPYNPTAVFTVSIPAPIPRNVTVHYATQDGTATAPADYEAAAGTLTIPAGSTSAKINVTVYCDTIAEGVEWFSVLLSDPVNAPIAKAVGECSISDLRLGWRPCCYQAFQIRFKSSASSLYRLEFSPAMDAQASWFPVPGAELIQGTGQDLEITDQTAAQQSQRFYRLVVLQ